MFLQGDRVFHTENAWFLGGYLWFLGGHSVVLMCRFRVPKILLLFEIYFLGGLLTNRLVDSSEG